jgi:hypothetical protein
MASFSTCSAFLSSSCSSFINRSNLVLHPAVSSSSSSSPSPSPSHSSSSSYPLRTRSTSSSESLFLRSVLFLPACFSARAFRKFFHFEMFKISSLLSHLLLHLMDILPCWKTERSSFSSFARIQASSMNTTMSSRLFCSLVLGRCCACALLFSCKKRVFFVALQNLGKLRQVCLSLQNFRVKNRF